MKVRISVCIATYNGAKYIRQQLDSILPQLSANDEIVISDDSSTDDTVEIIRSFADKRIRIFEGQNYKSPIFNFENAIKNSSGEYIFLSDQDDIWKENKVKVMLKALEDHDLVVSNAEIADESLKIIKESYFAWRHSKSGILKNLIRNSYLGCCMAFSKNLLTVILPFPKKIPMHDMWIGMIAEFHFKPAFIDEKLIIYRRHGGNATVLNEDYTSKESWINKLAFRVNLMTAVFGRSTKHLF